MKMKHYKCLDGCTEKERCVLIVPDDDSDEPSLCPYGCGKAEWDEVEE